ncbi:PrgI family protein [Candidatus Pacearchaeota archaeon]|nr:PrgI family protein [Candidatus Pacearchaeota archaeon]
MYEIPQQLEYKEKIVFGLTFGQLFYALVFFPIVFSLLFKLKAPLEIRIFLTMFPIILATGFMFFDLSIHLKNWYTWFKLRELKDPEKIKQAFGIGNIKEVFFEDDKKK